MNYKSGIIFLILLLTVFIGAQPSIGETGEDLLDAAGIKGGLIVHLGCGDGVLTALLHKGGSYTVQGLDADPDNVNKAREHILSLGIYGKVSADTFDGQYLPYADNLVNLVISEDTEKVSMAEIMRILCPKGVAYIKKNGQWEKSVKPRPGNIDEWPHFLHDAGNNAVAQDEVAGPPPHVAVDRASSLAAQPRNALRSTIPGQRGWTAFLYLRRRSDWNHG